MNRLLLPVLLLFWGVMTFLLWRSEYGGAGDFGTSLPAEVVWQRMLTAPDDSALEIRHGRERIGRVVWAPNVGQELETGKVNDLTQEGRVINATHYTIDLDGIAQLAEGERGFRFSSQLRFLTNHTWDALGLRLSQRPNRWALAVDATNRTIELSGRQDGVDWERAFTFEELQRPERLLAEMGVPRVVGLLAGAVPPGLLGGGAPGGGGFSPGRLAADVKVDARQDWYEIGNTRLRAYRLRLQLGESLRVTVFLSRAGEILRAEFPDHWVFINEKFLGY